MFIYSSASASPFLSQATRIHNRVKTEKVVKTRWTGLGNHVLRYAVMLLLLCGCNAAMAGDRGTKSDKVTRKGADIFKHYCSVCHGDKGNGQSRARGSFAVPPRDYTSPESAIELTRDRMIHSVTNGRPGTAMIAWNTELTAAEIEGVVDYIRGTFMQLGSAGTNAKPSDKLLSSHGGVLYMQACAMCHGETGRRPISGRMQPPPTDFTLPKAASELTRQRMITSVTNGRPGTAMRSYSSEYSKGDIEDIVDFIRAAYMTTAKPKK
jgi:mono/diheme cytochrome c family protein